MGNFVFVTSCINSTAERIHEMIDIEQSLSRHQFIFHTAKDVGIDQEIVDMLGYTAWGKDVNRSGHKLFADDYALSCHKSWYVGVPCYYVRHSAIEYIFVDKEHLTALNDLIKVESARSSAKVTLEENWEILVENAKLLGINLSLAAKRFGQGNSDIMKKYRIPFQSFAVIHDAGALRQIQRWDRQNLN